jgi:cyclic beta-1,2-glucan synthetase
VWSAAYHPIGGEPEDYLVTFLAEKAVFHRLEHAIETQLEIAVSAEDDVEVHRLSVTNRSDEPREIEVTSYAEIVLAPPADDLAHPVFSKLFVETEYLSESAALLCTRRMRAKDAPGAWAVHVLSVEGRMQGPVEWESGFWAAVEGRRIQWRSMAGRSREPPGRSSIPSSACVNAFAWPRGALCGCRLRPGWP